MPNQVSSAESDLVTVQAHEESTHGAVSVLWTLEELQSTLASKPLWLNSLSNSVDWQQHPDLPSFTLVIQESRAVFTIYSKSIDYESFSGRSKTE